ncbi:GHKL domain-containing protein [Lusitaniella coriacea LEGE 07157]|uniref:histidine kinase n=1 Tax=Lusitaniella coriacea LEGE 07157 TaxID=945747 RepID=A0A8J7IV34_9CYAN|nr:ATP-binding protein [Lusitaniella coriacea]MBE9118142.1 GHKL domain-containing protein [Lusitaniella coriacea LEGE 07157]
MDLNDNEKINKQLEKENRILKKKIERLQEERKTLEKINRNKEEVFKKIIQELQDHQATLEKKSRDLKEAFDDLKMMENKMSSLGGLVAGVAHEINNPIGFLAGNLKPAEDYVRDLLGLISLYQDKFPNPGEEIEEEIEAIDFDFVRKDLLKLLTSMKEGINRIRNISNSLRTFARTDIERLIPFDIHEGIDSTLLILKHRLKANEDRPVIEILKKYDDLPLVKCFPGQLNQVFMNVLANAIDALEESNKGKSYAQIEANPNRITIQTQQEENCVIIRIGDNGKGMFEAVRRRIFEQTFTTKGVGKGTGLGLAIARKIIEEKHGGSLHCTSEPGNGTEFAISLPLEM